MNIIDHNPNCGGPAWQLQYKIEDGKEIYRTICVGCGRTSDVTETEAKNWNRSSEELIKLTIPEIIE